IYYILQYISKREACSHTKLSIGVVVRDAMKSSAAAMADVDVDVAKSFLIKTYNKLDTLCEVGTPEAISHLLEIPDHYTDAIFTPIHTSFLLFYAKQLSSNAPPQLRPDGVEGTEALDATIIRAPDGYSIVSQCDDYAHRGPAFDEISLYDYVCLVYKRKEKGGAFFSDDHPQHNTHYQFVRQESYS